MEMHTGKAPSACRGPVLQQRNPVSRVRVGDLFAQREDRVTDETGDRRSKDPATRADHARRFSQTEQAVLTFGQVVQRAEKQGNVEGIILELKITSIADVRVECALAFGLVHLSRNRIDQDHVMTQFSQGCGMNAGRAPYIEDMRARTDTAGNQFLDALELQTALSGTYG